MGGHPTTTRAPRAHFPTVPASYSRLPHDDEKLVLRAFARHTTSCSTCSSTLSSGTLCSRGYARAVDVEEYVYPRKGRAYSAVDLKKNQRVQIEIPADTREAVEELLSWMEDGGVREVRVKGGKSGSHSPSAHHHTGKHAHSPEPKHARVKKYRVEEPRHHGHGHGHGEYRQHARPMVVPVVQQPATPYYTYAAPVMTGGYYYY